MGGMRLQTAPFALLLNLQANYRTVTWCFNS